MDCDEGKNTSIWMDPMESGDVTSNNESDNVSVKPTK